MNRIVLLLIGLLALTACSDNNGKKKKETAPVPITAAQATARDIPVRLQVVGRAEAFESVALKPRIDGQVASVLFTEGQAVRQGDVLIRLDPTDLLARLHQAEAAAARDEALLAKAHADVARYSALRQRNFISEEKLNDIRTNEAAATANLRASRAAAEFARLQHTYTTIRAPFSGVVGARLVFPGSAVKANDVILAVVNRVSPLLVNFAIPEKHLPQLRSAMQSGEIKVDIALPDQASQRFEGKLRFIDNTVDSSTGTILLKAELPNRNGELTPGQFLDVTLLLDTLKQAVTVPNSAVQQGPEGNYVYVIKEDGKAEMRKVEVRASADGFTALRGKVEAGDTVVTDGHLRLVPGAKVKIKEADTDSKGDKPGKKTGESSAVASPAN